LFEGVSTFCIFCITYLCLHIRANSFMFSFLGFW